MKATLLAAVVLAFSTSHALAVSLTVKLACKDDYYAHCSQHAVGSPGVRKCMKDVGPRLSTRCIGALADAGMIQSKAITQKYRTKPTAKTNVARKHTAKKQYAKKSQAKTQYAAKPDTAKRVASKASSAKKTASKSDRKKQRYADKASKKRVAKKDRVQPSHSRKHIAYVD